MRRRPHPYAHGDLVLVIDCADLARSTEFWSGVLGYVREGAPAGRYQGLVPPSGEGLEVLLQRVPEYKRAKNRLHLDLRTRDLESEVERVTGLGAITLTEEPVTEFGWRWHILGDPDGNEFCVLQPPDSFWEQHEAPGGG
ncbi:MAG TPA: VOC family protein [Streptosporangiaceae bacterium]